MPLKVSTRKRIRTASIAVVCILLAAIAFVFYFMHAVYEVEEILNPSDLPREVLATFQSRFPEAADVIWKPDEGLYEASFSWQGKEEVEALFRPDGRLTSTEYLIDFSELPERAQAYLREQELDVEDVERRESEDGTIQYEAQLGNALMEWDCVFDADGNLLSRDRDGPVLENGPVPE